MALPVTNSFRGASVRPLLLAAVIVPLAAGAMALLAIHSGRLGAEASLSLFAISSAIVLAGLVWANAARQHKAEAAHDAAQTALQASEQRTRLQLERMNLLDHITRAIAERRDVHSIFQVAVRSLEEHLPVDFGCVGLIEPGRSTMRISCVGIRSRALALELALTEQSQVDIDINGLGRCLQGLLVYEPDIAGSPWPFTSRLAGGGLHALVFAPLRAGRQVFAVLVAGRRDAASFSSADCEFLRQLSEHLALASQQSQLHSALQQAYDDLRQTHQSIMDQERLRTLGQMASGIAHDINNALSPAALYAESLIERDQSLSPQARAYLAVIQRAIEGVAGTVARLREFYRPREPALTFTPIDLNRVLNHVAELTRVRWSSMPQQHGFVIELRMDLSPDLPNVLGAENEIQDAVTNLVLNAIDAMPAGGALTLRSRVAGGGGDSKLPASTRAWIEVGDSGIGMTEEARRRCIEPFYTTKGERGTGLGLAMVYGMAQRHSAELTIDSKLREGATVRLSFPIAATGADLQAQQTLQQDARPLRILLVDDDPLLLKSLRDILESDGHTVHTADGGQAGIDAFLAAEPVGGFFDVVMTDLGMPNLDGRAVASVIRAAAPSTSIVMLTGWGQSLQGDNKPEYVDAVLSKPPRIAELRAMLAAIPFVAGNDHA